MIDHAGLVTPGLYYFDGSDHTPMSDVLERFSPDLAPTRDRASLCAEIGIDPGKKTLLYLASSNSVAGRHENRAATQWAESVRSSSSPALSCAVSDSRSSTSCQY